jgi:protein-S-isoprenylcysteine O-methyltransferase Ste14
MVDIKQTSRGGIWVVGQFILLTIIVAVGQLTVGHFTTSGLTMIAGALLCVVSLAFGWRGFVHLGKNLTAFPKPLDDGQLVTTGVYAIVRHPIYTSVLSGCFGYVLLSGSWVAGIVTLVLCGWFEYKSRAEERFLYARFPAYAAYAQSTKKFIPYIF